MTTENRSAQKGPFLLRFAEVYEEQAAPPKRENSEGKFTEVFSNGRWLTNRAAMALRGGNQTKTTVVQESTDFK